MNTIYSLAEFLSKNVEKEDIITEIFKLFDIDCLERAHFTPSALDKLIKSFNEKNECDTAILEEIISLIKSGRESTQMKENELIKEIYAYIDNTFTEDVSIEKIAEELHISYYYMCHVFKSKTGISVSTYRIRKRMEKAMRALIETDERISDIAAVCGYNSISYFTETFTRYIGIAPTVFREQKADICLHPFYNYNDMSLAAKTNCIKFLSDDIKGTKKRISSVSVRTPDKDFNFLHEAAIIEYHGVLYTSWYLCPQRELRGFTPICGKRSSDSGETWTELEFICADNTEKILYCPPIYGICEDRLYMLVNQMVAPDHIHSLDLYILNNESDKFELLWSRPIPFKLNTNVVTLPNGKLMLPGRIGKLDGFPNTPAVLISDSGKIDAEWRLVKIAENGILPDGTELVHPEISVICAEQVLYMFCRNDQRKVPLVYVSKDLGETWSAVCSHDIPYVSSKIYCGELNDGRHYLICNTDKFNRTRLTVYFTEDKRMSFTKRLELFDTDEDIWGAMHYPAACESDGYLYVIATKGYENGKRGAELFKIDLKEI